jgi:hypothetical protein
MKYNANTLKKIEDLLKAVGYTIRSGKGSFNTGYCVLEAKRVIVVNNFHSLEAKINALAELLQTLNINTDTLTDEQRQTYDTINLKLTK